MEIKYSHRKIITHYLKTLVYGSFFYVCAFAKSDDYRLKNFNVIFIYISVIYIIISLFCLIKDLVKYYKKTFLRIDNDFIFVKKLKIEKHKISDIRFFIKSKKNPSDDFHLPYISKFVDQKYFVIVDLIDAKSIEIDISNIFLEGSPLDNYQKISNYALAN